MYLLVRKALIDFVSQEGNLDGYLIGVHSIEFHFDSKRQVADVDELFGFKNPPVSHSNMFDRRDIRDFELQNAFIVTSITNTG